MLRDSPGDGVNGGGGGGGALIRSNSNGPPPARGGVPGGQSHGRPRHFSADEGAYEKMKKEARDRQHNAPPRRFSAGNAGKY